jgi:hypothetical protein
MADLEKTRNLIYTRYKNLKSLHYIINNNKNFKFLFNRADENTQNELIKLIEEVRVTAIKNWIRKQKGPGIIELRKLGAKYAIRGYTKLKRNELIKALSSFIEC